jgi:hypothetical protein
MSFYDPEQNHNFILSPREISFINRNTRKQNNQIKKHNAITPTSYGKEIPIEDDYIPLSSEHPNYPFYSHINDIYCFKIYSLKEIIAYNCLNKTRFIPLINERITRKKVIEKPCITNYDIEGNIIFPFKIIPSKTIKSIN